MSTSSTTSTRPCTTKLMVKPFLQDIKRGVFVTRAPCRPNAFGLSVVELVRRDNNVLDPVRRGHSGRNTASRHQALYLQVRLRQDLPQRVAGWCRRGNGSTTGPAGLQRRRYLMIFAVASGKGGTGKTTVSVNMARMWGSDVQLLDCDVEEPNAHLFLNGDSIKKEIVTIPIPEVDESLCDGCGECGRLCAYHAIVSFGSKAIVFPEMCHGCGGCALVCPRVCNSRCGKAHRCGGNAAGGEYHPDPGLHGRRGVMAPPLIRDVKARFKAACPPFWMLLPEPRARSSLPSETRISFSSSRSRPPSGYTISGSPSTRCGSSDYPLGLSSTG